MHAYVCAYVIFRPKHPLKVHVWAGISLRGATQICIFDGIMDALLYVEILRSTLLPFIAEKYPEGHRFMQDNDPKHTSRLAQQFFSDNNINWWKTSPESPDLNPIENLWRELKEFIKREVKPRTKEELIDGIKAFWRTVTKEKCTRYVLYCNANDNTRVIKIMFLRYIRHLAKVILKVLELHGEPTGY